MGNYLYERKGETKERNTKKTHVFASGIRYRWKGTQQAGKVVASGGLRNWGDRVYLTVYLFVSFEYLNVNLFLIWKYE